MTRTTRWRRDFRRAKSCTMTLTISATLFIVFVIAMGGNGATADAQEVTPGTNERVASSRRPKGEASMQRLTPDEIKALRATGPGAGTSGVAGIRTRILAGDPTKKGIYTIQLELPANTRIEAHDHPDDRVATVVAGTWNFGFGTRFDEKALKALPAGSFYTEPPNEPHFALTGDSPVFLHITGFGPTGTRYVDPKNAPATKP
jgi:quercetin dioxygenase-like cupin family protein